MPVTKSENFFFFSPLAFKLISKKQKVKVNLPFEVSLAAGINLYNGSGVVKKVPEKGRGARGINMRTYLARAII